MSLFGKKQKSPLEQQASAHKKSVEELQNILAPSAIKIDATSINIGGKLARTLFVITYPRFLSTGWFAPIINMDSVMDISLFVHPVETAVVLKNLRKKAAQIGSQISLKQEKGFVRDPVLETASQDIEELRDRLQQGTEKLFKVGLYVTIYGDDENELDKTESEIISLLEARLVYLKPAIFQQKEGFTSTSPIAQDKLEVHASLNSGPLSTIYPFVSADLSSGKGILYGINRHNNSLILFDRFSMENANTVVFGKSGGGKSYAAKLEILRSLMLGVDVIVIDPENEYEYLAEAVGGSYFRISLTSPHHINPFDLPPVPEDEDPANTLRSNMINLLGLIKIMIGGLTPEEDAILDRAIADTYVSRDISPERDFTGKTPPLLDDLETVLHSIEGGEGLATKLSKFTRGTFSGFMNQQTNVQMKNRLTVFSIRDMEESLRPIAMYIVLNYIWNAIRAERKKRIVVVDEAWQLMKYEDGGSFLFGIAKRARKYYLGLTTITQDIPDFMSSSYGMPIVTNSSIQMLFKQSPATGDAVQQTFNLTNEEKYLLLEANVGEGIFFAGLKHVAMKVVASYTEDQIITSDPAQLMAIEKAKKEYAREEGRTPGADIEEAADIKEGAVGEITL